MTDHTPKRVRVGPEVNEKVEKPSEKALVRPRHDVMFQDFWDKRTRREYFFLALGRPKELSLKWRRRRRRDRDRRRLRIA